MTIFTKARFKVMKRHGEFFIAYIAELGTNANYLIEYDGGEFISSEVFHFIRVHIFVIMTRFEEGYCLNKGCFGEGGEFGEVSSLGIGWPKSINNIMD